MVLARYPWMECFRGVGCYDCSVPDSRICREDDPRGSSGTHGEGGHNYLAMPHLLFILRLLDRWSSANCYRECVSALLHRVSLRNPFTNSHERHQDDKALWLGEQNELQNR